MDLHSSEAALAATLAEENISLRRSLKDQIDLLATAMSGWQDEMAGRKQAEARIAELEAQLRLERSRRSA